MPRTRKPVTTDVALIALLKVITEQLGPKVAGMLMAEAHREALAEAAKRK